PWTADTAREEAERRLSLAKLGQAPVHDARANRTALTVANLCTEYLVAAEAGTLLKRNGEPKKPRTIRHDRGRNTRHIVPLLGKKLAKDVTSADVRRFVDDVTTGETAKTEKRTEENGVNKHGRLRVEGGPGAARRALELLGSLFTFALDRGFRAD